MCDVELVLNFVAIVESIRAPLHRTKFPPSSVSFKWFETVGRMKQISKTSSDMYVAAMKTDTIVLALT